MGGQGPDPELFYVKQNRIGTSLSAWSADNRQGKLWRGVPRVSDARAARRVCLNEHAG